jgi:hypothetical protein
LINNIAMDLNCRAKRKDNKEWVYGHAVLDPSKKYAWIKSISVEKDGRVNRSSFEVDPNTVGLHTGFNAQKGKVQYVNTGIYEGDVFRGTEEDNLVVMWIKQLAAFRMVPVEHYEVLRDNDVSCEPEFAWLFVNGHASDFRIDVRLPKIGNIFDHPELLQ